MKRCKRHYEQTRQRTSVAVQQRGIVAIQRSSFTGHDKHGHFGAVLARYKYLLSLQQVAWSEAPLQCSLEDELWLPRRYGRIIPGFKT
jgi:hypothetical protein